MGDKSLTTTSYNYLILSHVNNCEDILSISWVSSIILGTEDTKR